MENKYIELALKEANKAYQNGDFPVGCVVTYNNKIIAKAHNKKEKNNNAIEHAEILAISKTCKKLNTWHLEDVHVIYNFRTMCNVYRRNSTSQN